MTDTLEEKIENQLREVLYPGLNRDIVSFGFVRDIEVRDGGQARVTFQPSTTDEETIRTLEDEVIQTVSDLEPIQSVVVRTGTPGSCGGGNPSNQDEKTGRESTITSEEPPTPSDSPGEKIEYDRQDLPGVNHVIAVASGKGGVGKSTVAVNLTEMLHRRGWNVGLADLDIYGPSAPTMFGLRGRPTMNEEGKITPLESHGIQVMSIGFMLGDREPTVWRGPLVMQAVEEFLYKVSWEDRDVLITDLPPGTGDVQLSLLQTVELDGAVVVTTPQILALLDVDRSVEMCRNMDVPILGIVENMSQFICDECGKDHRIFGEGGGSSMAQRLDVPFLGELPIHPEIREGGDQGRPLVQQHPDWELTDRFESMAESLEEQLLAPHD